MRNEVATEARLLQLDPLSYLVFDARTTVDHSFTRDARCWRFLALAGRVVTRVNRHRRQHVSDVRIAAALKPLDEAPRASKEFLGQTIAAAVPRALLRAI